MATSRDGQSVGSASRPDSNNCSRSHYDSRDMSDDENVDDMSVLSSDSSTEAVDRDSDSSTDAVDRDSDSSTDAVDRDSDSSTEALDRDSDSSSEIAYSKEDQESGIAPPGSHPRQLQGCPDNPEDGHGSRVLSSKGLANSLSANSKGKDRDSGSVEILLSPKLIAQFMAPFITTPLCPKTTTLPYPNGVLFSKPPFPTRRYKPLHLENTNTTMSPRSRFRVMDIAKAIGRAVRYSSPSEIPPPSPMAMEEMTPTEMRRVVRRALKIWFPNGLPKERGSRYGVDMNVGWNRARHRRELMICDDWFEDYPEEAAVVKTIGEQFNAFSFWKQLAPLQLDRDQPGYSGRVFMGDRSGSREWLREPGRWWPAMKPLFGGCRGQAFFEGLAWRLQRIALGVEQWKKSAPENREGNVKRKAQDLPEGADITSVAQKRTWFRTPPKGMSEAWRARRRSQEKRAGRWTDGTLRMDRMWEEFFWVLNVDDPLDAVWKRKGRKRRHKPTILEASGSDIWRATGGLKGRPP